MEKKIKRKIINKKSALSSTLKLCLFSDRLYKRSQKLILAQLLLFIISIVILVNVTGAITADIGCPYTYHKNYATVNNDSKYTQFAFRWDYSQDVQINKVALYRYWTDGQGGPYDIKIVNDNNGVPGTTVYAQNISWSEHGARDRERSWIPLNTTLTLPANTYCWVVVDGRNVSDGNDTQFATFDRKTLIPDGSYGFDYQRWSTAGWNGSAWVTPALSGSNYPMYGSIVMYNNNTIVGDGQFAINEATFFVHANQYDGQKITNAPSEAFKINDMKIRMMSLGNYGNVYFVVLDRNLTEIANRTIMPTDNGTWVKQTYTFNPPIEIGAGNSTIICIIKAPQATDRSNGIQVRGIEYISDAVSYPYGNRFATGAGGLSHIWTDPQTAAMDAMMNFSITYGEERSVSDYYVSTSGNNCNDGNSSLCPWKTLAYASSHLPANSTLWLMPGIYENDTLTLEGSNINVSALSKNVTISGSSRGIQGNDISNITVTGITLTGQTAISIYFTNSNNITVSNCSIKDGYDGIRFRGCNDSLAQDNFITNMTGHGIHIFCQYLSPIYSNNNVIRNNISNCEHNMIDVHSNVSHCTILSNDVYFTDSWTGNKNNIGIYLHNGNTPNIVVENNTVHHIGRPLELNNVNDCIIRNNNFYDGLTWGSRSSSRILIAAVNGTVPCDPFGCNNITFSENRFSGLGYIYSFYHEGTINASFTNFTFRDNTYNNVEIANLRKDTSKPTSNIVFKDEKFMNFTIIWNKNTINTGDIKFENTSSHSIHSDGANNYSIYEGVVSLDIDNSTTDIWYGDIVPDPLEPILSIANFSSNVTSGSAPLDILFTDTSTGTPIAWNWNFGDGTYSAVQNSVHTYLTAGVYTVILTITDANGNKDSDTCTVTVLDKLEDTVKVDAVINISPSSNNVTPGETFTIDLLIDPSTPITGAQLDFLFNSSMVSASGVTEGNLFKQNGAQTIFSSGTIDNSAGAVKNIYGLILGTSSVSSPGTMATVNLTAGHRTGMAEFSLSNMLISDANSKSVQSTVKNATVLIDTAPVMNPICDSKSVDEKSTLAFKVSAKDADCDRLILSASGLPAGASFNKTSGAFAWTPAAGQAGIYTFTFEVSDGYLKDSQSVTVTVNKLNNPPVINYFEPLSGSSFSEGERINISVNASDADRQALNYSIRIDGVTCSTGTAYVWETDYSSSGNHIIQVVVSDGIEEVKKQSIIYISECHPRWDVNEDGVVNILDITKVSQMHGTTVSKPYPRYDVNQDGVVNIQDLTLVGYHFGETVK